MNTVREVIRFLSQTGFPQSRLFLSGSMRARLALSKIIHGSSSDANAATPDDEKEKFIRFPGWPSRVRRQLSMLPEDFITGYSLNVESACLLFWYSVLCHPRVVLETGCGISTVIFGMAAEELSKKGHRLRMVSIENQPEWRDRTILALEAVGVTKYVEMVYAPLFKKILNGEEITTYNLKVGKENEYADLLFIDGPPSAVGRGPVLPLLKSRLNEKCLVLLDDACRDAENSIAREWGQKGIASLLGFLPLGKGLAVLECD